MAGPSSHIKLTGVIGAGIFMVASVVTVGAIEYGGIGGRPAYPRPNNPRSESIFIYEVTPGQKIDEGVRVVNNTEETKTLIVYGADSTPSTDGGFACEQQSEEKDQVGSWNWKKK